jgi:hypothetical protein
MFKAVYLLSYLYSLKYFKYHEHTAKRAFTATRKNSRST